MRNFTISQHFHETFYNPLYRSLDRSYIKFFGVFANVSSFRISFIMHFCFNFLLLEQRVTQIKWALFCIVHRNVYSCPCRGVNAPKPRLSTRCEPLWDHPFSIIATLLLEPSELVNSLQRGDGFSLFHLGGWGLQRKGTMGNKNTAMYIPLLRDPCEKMIRDVRV